jgi:hypothetical protein
MSFKAAKTFRELGDSTRALEPGQHSNPAASALAKKGTLSVAAIYFGADFPYHVRCWQNRAWARFRRAVSQPPPS